jgi:hypothetical protein
LSAHRLADEPLIGCLIVTVVLPLVNPLTTEEIAG